MTARAPYETVLQGEHVRLRPLRASDGPALFSALRDPSIWTWLSAAAPANEQAMGRLVDAVLAVMRSGTRFCWVVEAGTTVAGWTSYGDFSLEDGRIEIGWTAYGVQWQRTAVNTETKLLLLGHAFDELGYQRVTLKTDARNERSQRAIERLGAVREGVLRRMLRRPDGTLRDSVYYSILDDEWPAVRRRLSERGLRPRAHAVRADDGSVDGACTIGR